MRGGGHSVSKQWALLQVTEQHGFITQSQGRTEAGGRVGSGARICLMDGAKKPDHSLGAPNPSLFPWECCEEGFPL